MKIGSFESKPVTPASGSDRKGGAASGAAKADAATPASTQVALSPEAALLSKVATDPSFDVAKVDRIATAIRNGQYRVNPEAIAEKLIVNAEELLGRKLS